MLVVRVIRCSAAGSELFPVFTCALAPHQRFFHLSFCSDIIITQLFSLFLDFAPYENFQPVTLVAQMFALAACVACFPRGTEPAVSPGDRLV